jgi:hypothetical protein
MTAVAAEAAARRALVIYFPFAEDFCEELAVALGVGAGLGPAVLAFD